jgi:hypothetical protein
LTGILLNWITLRLPPCGDPLERIVWRLERALWLIRMVVLGYAAILLMMWRMDVDALVEAAKEM